MGGEDKPERDRGCGDRGTGEKTGNQLSTRWAGRNNRWWRGWQTTSKNMIICCEYQMMCSLSISVLHICGFILPKLFLCEYF